MKIIDLILPCFNEHEIIQDTINKIYSYTHKFDNYNFNLIFINDGSTDNTFEILYQNSIKHKNLKIINFTRNFGHQSAITAGINNSTGDAAIIIDSDLQDPLVVIDKMIIEWENDYDVVYGKRNKRYGESFFKKITAKLYYKFLNLVSDIKIPEDTGDFRLISKKVIIEFKKLKENKKYVRGLIAWMGFKTSFILYDRQERLKGTTKYNLIKMLSLAFDGLTSFSSKFLRIIGLLGIIISIISIILMIYVFVIKSFDSDIVKGWASLATIMLFFSGINFIFLGIISEYIARIFTNQQNRSDYIVENKINFEK